MAIDWPNLAIGTNIGVLHTSANGDTWRWNGNAWDLSKLQYSGNYGGPWVIFDLSYVPNYFADLPQALASSVNGDTIYLVTSVTEIISSTIILKDGVNINLNGNTCSFIINSEVLYFSPGIKADSIKCKINNGFVNFSNNTINFTGVYGKGPSSDLDLTGLKVNLSANGSCTIIEGSLNGGYFYNGSFGTGLEIRSELSTKVRFVKNAKGESLGGFGIYISPGTMSLYE